MRDVPEVTVVVVTFDSASLLPELFASLPPGMGDTSWRLVVVDNDSQDGSADLAARLRPDAVVVQTGRNAGYAAAVNAGVAAVPSREAVLVLNPDVRLRPGCVPVLLEVLRRPGTGIAAPRLLDGDGVRIDSMRREPSLLRAAADALVGARRAGRIGTLGETVSDEAAYRAEATPDWVEGSTMLVSRACLDRCGPWDESFFLYSEETEFALRARDAGWVTRYTPAAEAVHLEGGSNASPRLWALVVTNRVRLYRRRYTAPATAAFWALVLLRETSRAVLGKATSRAAVRALVDVARWRRTPGPQELLAAVGGTP